MLIIIWCLFLFFFFVPAVGDGILQQVQLSILKYRYALNQSNNKLIVRPPLSVEIWVNLPFETWSHLSL